MGELLKSVDIGTLHLEKPVMNGAGPVKLPEHVLEIAQSEASAIVLGSITVDERAGNQGRTYYTDSQNRFTLNSRGLPNPGLSYYEKILPDMVRIAHDRGKPLIVSAAGFSPDEYARIAEVIIASGADGQELNLGCPNVWGRDGKQKRIASFDEDLTGEVLRKVEDAVGKDAWTSVKVSPFSDPLQLQAIGSIISRSQLVNAVTAINTFPNAFFFNDEGLSAIDPGGGLAGMAGEALKPIALGQVKQLREILPNAIVVIGVGGIANQQDIEDYLRAGAGAVQITSAYINFGPSVFKTST